MTRRRSHRRSRANLWLMLVAPLANALGAFLLTRPKGRTRRQAPRRTPRYD